jgi:O-antigen ligase
MLVAIPLIPAVVLLFYRRPFLLLVLWPICIFISVFYPYYPVARIGTMILLPMDIAYVFTISQLGLCALLTPAKVGAILKQNRFLSIFLGVAAVYVVVCTPIYGQSALGEARKDYLMFLFPLLALLSVKRFADLRRFLLFVILIAGCIATFALIQGAMSRSLLRVLNAPGTLIIGLAMFSMIIHRIYKMVVFGPIVDLILLFLLCVIVLLSGQRTVWLAVGAGFMLLLWFYRRRSAVMTKVVMFAAFGVFGLVVGFAVFPEAGSRLTEKFAGIIDPSEDTTASWRMEGWRQQLSRLQGAKLIFGEGLGGYYKWRFSGETITVAPHNIYVQLMLKFGLFGLTMYGLLALEFFRKALAARKKLKPGPWRAYIETGILTFGAGHVYMVGYGFEPIMLTFVAVALSAAALSQSTLRTTQYSQLEKARTLIPFPVRSYPSRGPGPRPMVS